MKTKWIEAYHQRTKCGEHPGDQGALAPEVEAERVMIVEAEAEVVAGAIAEATLGISARARAGATIGIVITLNETGGV